MVLSNSGRKSRTFTLIIALSSLMVACPATAQSESPVPGANGGYRSAQPAGANPFLQQRSTPFAYPAAQSHAGAGSAPPPYSAPLPGASTAAAQSVLTHRYDSLPLNVGTAMARLEELRNAMPGARPKEFQDSISEYCQWLADLADSHWRLHQAFAKSDTTRLQAESERQLSLRFAGLKRQALLIKAQFLIGQRRYPEALGSLVDIVAAEPKTETGQSAYRLLQDIGFSDIVMPLSTVPASASNASAPAAAVAAPPASTTPASVAGAAATSAAAAKTAPAATAAAVKATSSAAAKPKNASVSAASR